MPRRDTSASRDTWSDAPRLARRGGNAHSRRRARPAKGWESRCRKQVRAGARSPPASANSTRWRVRASRGGER